MVVARNSALPDRYPFLVVGVRYLFGSYQNLLQGISMHHHTEEIWFRYLATNR